MLVLCLLFVFPLQSDKASVPLVRVQVESLKRAGFLGETARALLEYADAVLQLPGADPFLFPNKPGTLDTPTDVAAVFTQRMDAMRCGRGGPSTRSCRKLQCVYVCSRRFALSLLKDSDAACAEWVRHTTVLGLPPMWSSPAARLSADVKMRCA